MIVTEAMLVSMEELQRHAADMENHVKSMMEEEGRRHGLELDRRRNARELWNELNKHMANPPAPVAVDYEGGAIVMNAAGADEMPHHHGPDGEMIADEGDMVMEAVEEAAAMPDDGVMEVEDDTDSNAKS